MSKNDSLSLQANIICPLLALIGSTAIIEHPGWFGSAPGAVAPSWEFTAPAN